METDSRISLSFLLSNTLIGKTCGEGIWVSRELSLENIAQRPTIFCSLLTRNSNLSFMHDVDDEKCDLRVSRTRKD